MKFINANFFGDDGQFHLGGFTVENCHFSDVGQTSDGIDLNGAYVLPGLLDVHTHGNSGYDFSTCSEAELADIARAHAQNGLAGFCPTSMTLPEAELATAFGHAKRLMDEPAPQAAAVLGINMEGPFLAEKRKGAQNAAYLQLPDTALFQRLQQAAGGGIKLLDIAPELPGAIEMIHALKDDAVLSLAHADATYEDAVKGFDAGVSHVTHLFNAMPGLHHRTPGPVAAAAENDAVTVELVADGIHIHPSILRMCFRLFGAERICLISDSMEACGMADGEYQLGGQVVQVHGARAALADGTIAGSVTPLYRCMQNCIAWGIGKEEAVRAASLTPARRLGLQLRYGSIANGKIASFVITDAEFNLRQVYIRGEVLQ